MADVMREYLGECLRLVESAAPFGVLAHIDYPAEAWPAAAAKYDPCDFEAEYRAVLRALATSGRALEINTAGNWPAPGVLAWWREQGGRAVTLGSDSHEPCTVARGLASAAERASAAGFRPPRRASEPWTR